MTYDAKKSKKNTEAAVESEGEQPSIVRSRETSRAAQR